MKSANQKSIMITWRYKLSSYNRVHRVYHPRKHKLIDFFFFIFLIDLQMIVVSFVFSLKIEVQNVTIVIASVERIGAHQ